MQMQDPYLHVHACQRASLALARMGDAVADLQGSDGQQVHKSWWATRADVAQINVTNRKREILLQGGAVTRWGGLFKPHCAMSAGSEHNRPFSPVAITTRLPARPELPEVRTSSMTQYEYKVVPAPTKGLKAKGIKTAEGRFANSVESVLNKMGALEWEYLRAELLPSDERSGLTGSAVHWRNVLVFRRALNTTLKTVEPTIYARPTLDDDSVPQPASGAERMLKDDGVEEISPVSGMTTALKSRAKQQADRPTGDGASEGADSIEDSDDSPDTDQNDAKKT